MLPRFSRALALFSLPLIAGLAAGCAAPAADDDDAESVLAELNALGPVPVAGAPQGRSGFGPVTQPNSGYVANVTAAGSGCPAGSWVANISPDGQTFTLMFSAYETKLSPGQAFDIRQCLINIGLSDPQGFPLSFVVGSIYTQGYVALDAPGMRAARNATYTFGTSGGVAKGFGAQSQHSEIPGPYQNSYLMTDNVFAGRWSPCSKVSNLVVNTNLMLQNNVQRTGSAYLNTATVDGGLTLAFRLAWKHC